MGKDIFGAAQSGDLDALHTYLSQGVDLTLMNEYGFTALHCAVMGCNTVAKLQALAVTEALLKAGSPVNALSRDGRTPLYLAAEFSPTVEPLQMLIQAGAKADIRDTHGNHIVTNAMSSDVQAYLSALTGHPIPQPPLELASVKLSATEWRAAKTHLDQVFQALSQSKLIVIQDAGTTQEDGFSDCNEAFQAQGGVDSGLLGFCFYTRQDLNRAKRTSQLPLAFWGAPDGATYSMLGVGHLVVDTFRKFGFTVDWNDSPNTRPTVYLQNSKFLNA